MRVLIVTHYYPPEVGAPQARLSDLATMWAAAGHDVTVLTGMPNHPTGVVPPAYRRRLRVREDVDGVRVVRTWLYATPNEGILRKTLGHLSFMVSSVLLGGRAVGRQDVVVVSSPTFFSIFSAWFLARTRSARFVLEVRDLWPAIFVELGVLRNRTVIAALEVLERWAYRVADRVVVVTDGFRDVLVGDGVPAAKVEVIPNGVDLTRFDGTADGSRVRAALGGVGPETCVVLYAGAHGISHALPAVLAAASRSAADDVRWVFVGEGAAKRALVAEASARGLDKVSFHAAVPRDEMAALLAAADVCLVSLRDIPLFRTFIPSKMFEYLAVGRPVIGLVAGEPAAILTAAGAVVVPPEDADALAAAVRSLATDPDRRVEQAERGRAYVIAHHDRRALAERYAAVLADVVAGVR
ncbi:MAG: glycosyl transferase group 1 [Actinomycetia bacterium]|nr:glycosyl transferase group 1 [Actinomycetes bacterium]